MVKRVPLRTFECWWDRFEARDLIMLRQCWPTESLNLSHNKFIKLLDDYFIDIKYMLDIRKGII